MSLYQLNFVQLLLRAGYNGAATGVADSNLVRLAFAQTLKTRDEELDLTDPVDLGALFTTVWGHGFSPSRDSVDVVSNATARINMLVQDLTSVKYTSPIVAQSRLNELAAACQGAVFSHVQELVLDPA